MSPLVVDGTSSGRSRSSPRAPTAGLARAADEVARWVGAQLELAELDAVADPADGGRGRALRAQISPHFIYNSLGAIASASCAPTPSAPASCCWSSPTSPATRSAGTASSRRWPRSCARSSATSLLEQARFGDRLQVTLRIAPEVLPVAVPFLCIQPLVENAVRHGLEAAEGGGHDHDRRPRPGPGVRDRGRGRRRRRGPRAGAAGARRRRRASTPSASATSTRGCARRYGDEYGLVVETAPGAGTKVTVRVPKFAPGGCTRELTLARPGRRRRAAGPRRARLPARRDDRDRRGASPAARRPRRCGCCRSSDDRRGLPRHPDAGPRPGSSWPRCSPVPAPAAGRLRHRPRAARRRGLRAATPSTTCSSRCAPSGWPRRYAAWSCRRRRTRDAGAGARRCQVPVELGGVTRFVQPLRRSPTSRRRATTPGCTPPTGQPPGPQSR